MAITTTLAKMKNYFETWHIKEYDRLHTIYDDSDLRSLIQRIQNALPKDQYGNLTSIYSNTEIDNLITSIDNKITTTLNKFSDYYTKTEINTKVNTINTSISKKWDKNPSNGGWTWVDCCGSWDSSNITVWVNEQINMGMVHMSMPFTSAVAGAYYEWNYMNLPTKYRPNMQYYGACSIEGGDTRGGVGVLYVKNNGKLAGRFEIGWSRGDARTVYGTVWWRWKD